MYAAFQRHCCNTVGNIINQPETATPEHVLDIYRSVWELVAKGVTVCRYGSKSEPIVNLGPPEDKIFSP